MIAVNIDFPQADINAMNEAFKRYVDYYKGNIPKTVEKTCVQIIKALRGSTKVSPKIRPLVRNPLNLKGLDLRRAVWGVNKYKNGMPYFSPIAGSGEYGKIRYRSKKSLTVMEWDKQTGKRQKVNITNADLEMAGRSDLMLKNHPKRKINRSGLAKSSWGWMLGKLGKAAAFNQPEISGSTTVEKINNAMSGIFAISLTDKLKYIRKSMTGGNPVASALSRATNMMRYDMGEITRKAKTEAGLK
jgi:hypothetical protein